MNIFIDESGSFAGTAIGAISTVGALVVPDATIDFLERKWCKLRKSLPQQDGEVKGRLLNEGQISKIIDQLAEWDVLFEISATDLGLHTSEVIQAQKAEHAQYLRESLPRFAPTVRPQVAEAANQIEASSQQLYLQALTTFEVLHRTIQHATLYYVQREPRELGRFRWVVDGKDRTRVTNWENWWSGYAQGALATMSRTRPSPELEGADYSYYATFEMTSDDGERGTDLSKLFSDIQFSSDTKPGLELVDILANATRRALVGNLGKDGWQHLSRVMVHRKEAYIQFLIFGSKSDARYIVHQTSYAPTVKAISQNGKPMLDANFVKQEIGAGLCG